MKVRRRNEFVGLLTFVWGTSSVSKDYYAELSSFMLSSSHLSCLPEERWRQRRAPGDHSDPSCSVVLGTFQKLGLRPQTV